jgi:hypothetical protein
VTDYVFHDDYAVKFSLLLVATAAHLMAASLLWAGLKSFLISQDRMKEWTNANV